MIDYTSIVPRMNKITIFLQVDAHKVDFVLSRAQEEFLG